MNPVSYFVFILAFSLELEQIREVSNQEGI
jgi:hypothetical protein